MLYEGIQKIRNMLQNISPAKADTYLKMVN